MEKQPNEDSSKQVAAYDHLKLPPAEFRKHIPSKQQADKEFFIRKTFDTDLKKGYDLLFRHYYGPLCSHAVRYVYSKEVAEDLVCEVFMVFWNKSVHEHIQVSYRAYLFAAVRNRCLSYLKSEFKWTDSGLLEEFDTTCMYPQPDVILEYNELYMRIEKAIVSLPPQCQKVFLMSRFEGDSYPEIAKKLNISRKAVEAHIGKGLKILREALHSYTATAVLFLVDLIMNSGSLRS